MGSVFFYVGPDTDVFTLNRLLDQETEIIYVEPLIAFRNRERINIIKNTLWMDKREKIRRIDGLFECVGGGSTCAEPLNMNHINNYVDEITEFLKRSSMCDIPDNSLRDLHFLHKSLALDKITLVFMSNGILRNMTIYISTIQKMDPMALKTKNITTFSRLGVGPNGLPAKRYVCKNIDENLRIITNDHNPCVQHKVMCNLKLVEKNPVCIADYRLTANNQHSYSIISRIRHEWCAA